MLLDTIKAVWPILAILFCLFALGCARVLGAYMGQAIRSHDLVRESRQMRLDYLQSISERAMSDD